MEHNEKLEERHYMVAKVPPSTSQAPSLRLEEHTTKGQEEKMEVNERKFFSDERTTMSMRNTRYVFHFR
jgi:hypothetical protein